MFDGLSKEEKKNFLSQTHDNFIPGYTGHCPTLKFQYGRCYGTNTKEILKELRTKKIFQGVQKDKYRAQDYRTPILEPIVKSKGQFRDYYAVDFKHKAPKYITGYTGFIPTLNFRYGKSYTRAADDSTYESETNKHRRIQMAQDEINKIFRAQSAPKMISIRSEDEVKRTLNEYIERNKFHEHKISPEYPPIAGYTGHIPRVKGNEESLSQRYNTVVKRGLTLLQNERERTHSLKKAQNQVAGVLQDYEDLHKSVAVEAS
ncbi:hypothetical protein Zmor_008074 [Zophobas morio]|uniref:Ciliary microtubule inner protein 2A-C-like domain-containing protein n=1 Tax=Zophobas morio TaxID=2755281 RepID=A0AA38IU09_9CUCU|nr:hypothetical protein Zmor_008074 [Zophobas morio]